MSDKLKRTIKILIVVVIVVLFLWFLVISPYITFKKNENMMEKAAKRYYELNSTELPTGKRIATVNLQTLYHKSYLKEDFYVPYTNKVCSVTESWVKVKKVSGEYKYYTYLKCGALTSNIDSKGPDIKLKGSDEITINLGEKYEEPGVKSVVDNADGKMKISSVTINSKNVDTNKTGTYEVTYSVMDSLKNKTTVTRKVKVVARLKNIVNKETNKKGYYTGVNPNNYVSLSNMLFRIIGIDKDNVKVVAEEDVANIDYSKITSWLDYYLDESKKLLVKNKYCNMKTPEDNTITKCNSYTEKIYAYIPSVTDINKAQDDTGNFMKPKSMSWTANSIDKKTAYVTRNIFYNEYSNASYYPDKKTSNYGVRPVLTIKGNTLIKSGDGTATNPYSFGETPKAKPDDKINTRYTGEYINYSGMLWRIIEVNDDGTTKVISNDTIKENGSNIKTYYQTTSKTKIYNPTEKGNVGYYINNKVSEFIDTSYFVNKEVEVPIYKKEFSYGKETSTKKYKVKLSAPNMYEMFSAFVYRNDSMQSYWFINSSKTQYKKAMITDIGVVVTDIRDYEKYGVRVVGNLNKSVLITKGDGTYSNPYVITK